MSEYYEMGKVAALESLSDYYNDGGTLLGALEGIQAEIGEINKTASLDTLEDVHHSMGYDAAMMDFAKEASDLLVIGAEGDAAFEHAFEKVAKKSAFKAFTKDMGKHLGKAKKRLGKQIKGMNKSRIKSQKALGKFVRKNPKLSAGLALGAVGAGVGAKSMYDRQQENQTKAAAHTFLEMGLIDEEQFGNLIEAGYFE